MIFPANLAQGTRQRPPQLPLGNEAVHSATWELKGDQLEVARRYLEAAVKGPKVEGPP